MISGKRILLIITGGIAAYKSLELIRRLKDRGVQVTTILTRAAKEFVTPLSVASLSGAKVYDDLFNLTDESEMGHIELSRAADLVVVAPATADVIAKMAGGLADDLATTALLATDKRVLVAPAMNVRMWLHAATVRNVETLMRDGVTLVGPNEGDMACGEFGPGRMAEPDEIIAAIEGLLPADAEGPLSGRTVIVTAGPTHEPIDPVRYIANRSSGRQGHAIAAAAAALGARVVLVSGPTALARPPGIELKTVKTATEMLEAVERALPADIAIFAAAVADWRVATVETHKIKKGGGGKAPELSFVENPDILSTIAHRRQGRPGVVVGFAAETENVIANARSKLKTKGADLIVANDVGPGSGVLGGANNLVHIVTAGEVESWPELSKEEVARRLMDRLAGKLGERRKAAE
ncbi:MAG TPA: bifunctional phosphopantothenoylcysteine decarboxylase/phosphopantothenate--cysteine ligase CoaBC [Aestuariivirgaceae bacterium]|nr:bifunctional phosphopantothenoylcysteine decarboxylase/phosphopantothenate--cysteine ligase CoaBC [Aestuariivirgaceae bacterium]